MESQDQPLSTATHEDLANLKVKLHDVSGDSNKSNDEELSGKSKDSDEHKVTFPVFAHEVVVIRPEKFYENEDCSTDNKFMKKSGL